MTTIRMGQGRTRRREEAFADGELVVGSPKGIRSTERALLHALSRGKSGSALVVNSVEALAGMALRALNPGLAVHCHFDDAWDYAAAHATVRRHGAIAPELAIATDPPEGPWDLVLLPFEATGVADLLHERLESSLQWLRPGGLLFTSTDNPRDRFLREEVLLLFGSATTVPGPSRRAGVAYVARRPKTPKLRQRQRERTFTLREGERVLSFVSRPGVFCHGRLDEGTRALLASVEMGEAKRILDLGCGVGVLGAVAALRCAGARVTLVDSYARAVQCARRNIEALGLQERCETALTADPLRDLSPGYDLVLSNPPYYGDYRISEMFLATAAKVLLPGGRLALVTKGVAWHTAAMGKLFDAVRSTEVGGYGVLTAAPAI